MRRTPQGSSCPSSSSKSESEVRPGGAVNKLDHPIPECMPKMPYMWKSPNPYSLPETDQRTHLQPNCGQQEEFLHEQLELEALSADFVNQITKFNGEDLATLHYGSQVNVMSNIESILNLPPKVSSTCVKINQFPKIQELGNNLPKLPKSKDMGEFWYADEYLMNLASVNVASEGPNKLCADLESNWIGAEKTIPGWRTHKDDLASLVSHKSLECVGNCDLPQPLTEIYNEASSMQRLYNSKIINSSSDEVADERIFNMVDYANRIPTSANVADTPCAPGCLGGLVHSFDKQFRPTLRNSDDFNTTHEDEAEIPRRTSVNLSKTELLEALRHSQTRAREAEKAAKEAYIEKNHIIMLFFRQASHLFAYRQWFRILQLENLCLRLKNKDCPTCVHFPVSLPGLPHKGRRKRRGRQRVAKGKPYPSWNTIHKCAVAFAVGFSLASAGLFLGWTMGWFFPAI